MPPRKTTDSGALFEALLEDLRIQVAASVEKRLNDLNRRMDRIERRLDHVDPEHSAGDIGSDFGNRVCALCDKEAVARGLCSPHYQQWRYRERKTKPIMHHDNSIKAD